MADALVTAVMTFLGAKGSEGAQTRMYLDRNGLQTVGIGWLIERKADCSRFTWAPSVQAAEVDWQNLEDWRKAHPSEISTLGPAARPAAVSATLTEEYMRSHTLRMIEGKRSTLKTWPEFKDFDSFAPDIQMAILVRAWGPFSKATCPKFIAACGKKDWSMAMSEIKYAPGQADAGRNPSMLKMMQNGINEQADLSLNGKEFPSEPSFPNHYVAEKKFSEAAKEFLKLLGTGRETDWPATYSKLNVLTMTEMLAVLEDLTDQQLIAISRNLDFMGKHISRPRVRFALFGVRDRVAREGILDPEKDRGQFEEGKRYLERVPRNPRQIEF